MGKLEKPKFRGWTKEQDEFLTKVFNNHEFTLIEISEAIGKSESAIRNRAKMLGLKPDRKFKPYEVEGMKICPHCNELLPLDMFVKNASKKNGVSAYCISCDKIVKKIRAIKRKEEEIINSSNRSKLKEKKCTRCGEVKPISEYYKTGGMCKKCRNERNKEIDLEQLQKRGYSK